MPISIFGVYACVQKRIICNCYSTKRALNQNHFIIQIDNHLVRIHNLANSYIVQGIDDI